MNAGDALLVHKCDDTESLRMKWDIIFFTAWRAKATPSAEDCKISLEDPSVVRRFIGRWKWDNLKKSESQSSDEPSSFF